LDGGGEGEDCDCLKEESSETNPGREETRKETRIGFRRSSLVRSKRKDCRFPLAMSPFRFVQGRPGSDLPLRGLWRI
jgi:hypothetical protein